jgi:hypothetical protein
MNWHKYVINVNINTHEKNNRERRLLQREAWSGWMLRGAQRRVLRAWPSRCCWWPPLSLYPPLPLSRAGRVLGRRRARQASQTTTIIIIMSRERKRERRRGRLAAVAAGLLLCRSVGNKPGSPSQNTPRAYATRTSASLPPLLAYLLDIPHHKELKLVEQLAAQKASSLMTHDSTKLIYHIICIWLSTLKTNARTLFLYIMLIPMHNFKANLYIP